MFFYLFEFVVNRKTLYMSNVAINNYHLIVTSHSNHSHYYFCVLAFLQFFLSRALGTYGSNYLQNVDWCIGTIDKYIEVQVDVSVHTVIRKRCMKIRLDHLGHLFCEWRHAPNAWARRSIGSLHCISVACVVTKRHTQHR